MSIISLFRIIGVLIGYEAFITAFKIYRPDFLYLMVLLLLTALSEFILTRFKNKLPLKYLVSLIPAISLAFAHTTGEALALLIPVIYVAAVNLTEHFEVHYSYFQAVSKAVFVFDTFIFGYSLAKSSEDLLTYMLCYLSAILLILAGRSQRMGLDSNVNSLGMDFISVIGMTLLGGLGIFIIWLIIRYNLFSLIFNAVGMLVGMIILYISNMGISNIQDMGIRHLEDIEELPLEQGDYVEIFQVAEPVVEDERVVSLVGRVVMIVGIGTLLFFLIGAIYIVFRFFIKSFIVAWIDSKADKRKNNALSEAVNTPAYKKKKTKRAQGNYNRLRKIYREYLFLQKASGQLINKSDTSLDILEKSIEEKRKYMISEEALDDRIKNEGLLREIYTKARYSGTNEVSNEELKKARELIKKIKAK